MTDVTSHLSVMPYLYYEDLPAALDWLARVFGLKERFRLALPNGVVLHAELEHGNGVIMLGNVGPKNAERPETVRSGVYVFVDDVDAHWAQAKAQGAEIAGEPEDQPFGDRIYLAKDLEGHEWYFAQHLRDVAVEELLAGMGG